MMFEHTIEGCQCEGKRCSRCKEMKCHAAFPSDKRKASGITSPCLTCKRARENLRRAGNVEQARAYHREYRRIHAEHTNGLQRSYYLASGQKAKKQAYYRENAERIKDLRKVHQKIHSEQIRKYRTRRYQENAEQFKAQKR